MTKQTKLVVALSATALLALGLSAVSFAAGWDNSTGEWQYLDSNGDAVVDEWKKSGDYWFYLGNDGNMARNQIVEDDDDYYFVDEQGAMVTNAWKAYDKDDSDDIEADYYWYYFGSDGKAYTTDDGKELTTSRIKIINGKKYAFDSEGHMLYGWVDKESPTIPTNEDDSTAWTGDEYYFGDWTDGAMTTGWRQLTVYSSDDSEDKTYWFWFDSSDGTKAANKTDKKINGAKYAFAEDGHMLDEWALGTGSLASTSTASEDVVYLNGDGAQRKNTWVYAVPDEDYDNGNYEDDNYRWWRFNTSGNLVANKISKVNGKYYAFDEKGEMVNKFVVTAGDTVTMGSNGYDGLDEYKAGDWTRDEYLSKKVEDNLYYFSSDYEKDGSMQKGYVNVELDDGTYQFYFKNTTGKAVAQTDYLSKISKFVWNGLVLKTNSDDPSNFAGVDAVYVDSKNYDFNTTNGTKLYFYDNGDVMKGKILINGTGAIMKSKINTKDTNDVYYCTDDHGVIIYTGTKKAVKDANGAYTVAGAED